MSEELFKYFDAWPSLLKARKAKGLSKWDRLQGIAEKLQGKDVKAIAFTCSHPSHSGEPVKHLLGSVEGNLHFLLGYGNPKFHFAPYHLQVMDPSLSEEEALEAFSRLKHPSNPALWTKSGLTAEDEGDTSDGESHPKANENRMEVNKQSKRTQEAVKVQSPTGNYTAYPSEGIILGDHNNHVYRWDLAKDTFFSAQNPELTEAMENSSVQKSMYGSRFKEVYPDKLRLYAKQFKGDQFEVGVWPLVKSRIPAPGSIVKLATSQAETIYSVITPSGLEFYNRSSEPIEVTVFDKSYSKFDLSQDSDVPPAVLVSFLIKNFKVNTKLLTDLTTTEELLVKAVVWSVEGEPSPGFEDTSAEYNYDS